MTDFANIKPVVISDGKIWQYYQVKTVILYCIRCSLQFLKFMNVPIFGKCSLVTGTVDHLFVFKISQTK